VPSAAAQESLRQARLLQVLMAPDTAQDGAVVVADDHLPALVLASTPELTAALRRRMLAPLDTLPPERADVVEQTLRSWLLHDGSRSAVADDLVIHPQTVAYRMERVRKLFGANLDDPQRRWALRLAIMADEHEEVPSSSLLAAATSARPEVHGAEGRSGGGER